MFSSQCTKYVMTIQRSKLTQPVERSIMNQLNQIIRIHIQTSNRVVKVQTIPSTPKHEIICALLASIYTFAHYFMAD